MQHGLGWPGKSDVGTSILQPMPYVEAGKDLVFVTDLVLVAGEVLAGAKYQFMVNEVASGETMVLLSWGDTLVSRQDSSYSDYLKYSRLVVTGVDVLVPESFYDVGGGDRLEDPTWGVSPQYDVDIQIGRVLTTENPSNKNTVDADCLMWQFTGELNTTNVVNGCVKGTSYLPAVVGRTIGIPGFVMREYLVGLTMSNTVAGSITVPDPAVAQWRLRVVLRGYVA